MIYVTINIMRKIRDFAIYKNTSLGAIRFNYPLKEVRTSHVSLSRLLKMKYLRGLYQSSRTTCQAANLGHTYPVDTKRNVLSQYS